MEGRSQHCADLALNLALCWLCLPLTFSCTQLVGTISLIAQVDKARIRKGSQLGQSPAARGHQSWEWGPDLESLGTCPSGFSRNWEEGSTSWASWGKANRPQCKADRGQEPQPQAEPLCSRVTQGNSTHSTSTLTTAASASLLGRVSASVPSSSRKPSLIHLCQASIFLIFGPSDYAFLYSPPLTI